MIQVTTNHEGANPQDDRFVEQTGPLSFTVTPQSEDGDSNYKFAFDVVIENSGKEPVEVALTIDWDEPPDVGTMYMGARRSLFLGSGNAWSEVAGRLHEDMAHFSLPVPPGKHHACLSPPYTSEDLRAFFERAEHLSGTQHIVFGHTAEGRPLEALVLDALNGQESVLLVLGRGHPYETAGSYCVDGVLELLRGKEGAAMRAHRRVILAPVMNPDGAAHGLCKRTTLGCDITHEGRGYDDPTARAVVELVEETIQAGHGALWDVHGWMIAQDGMNFATGGRGQAIIDEAGEGLFPRGWKDTEPPSYEFDLYTSNFRRYAAALGMDVLVTSHPFWGRTPATMRQVGAAVCRAFVGVLGG